MFTFNEEHFLTLWKRCCFGEIADAMVFFGLRGCAPVYEAADSFTESADILDTPPDHRHMSCSIGQWKRGQGIALFLGSTVPHERYVAGGLSQHGAGVNQLMLSRIRGYTQAWHKANRPTGHPAFTILGILPVRRTADNLIYDEGDIVDIDAVYDNIHAAWSADRTQTNFSSAGCQVIAGYPACQKRGPNSKDVGPWAKFRNIAYSEPQTTFHYALFSASEVIKIATGNMSNMFASLRFGSGGDLVNELQQRLNEKGYDVGVVDGEFGKRTLGGVLKFQEDQFGNYADDGIVGSMTAAALGMHLPHLSEI